MERKYLSILLCYIAVLVIMIFVSTIVIPLEQRLDDCHFECNHLQVRLYRLQELSDYVLAMEQFLPPEALAQLKAATLMIQQKRWKEYERYEQPLLNEQELKILNGDR